MERRSIQYVSVSTTLSTLVLHVDASANVSMSRQVLKYEENCAIRIKES